MVLSLQTTSRFAGVVWARETSRSAGAPLYYIYHPAMKLFWPQRVPPHYTSKRKAGSITSGYLGKRARSELDLYVLQPSLGASGPKLDGNYWWCDEEGLELGLD